jgi:hypothetical protein
VGALDVAGNEILERFLTAGNRRWRWRFPVERSLMELVKCHPSFEDVGSKRGIPSGVAFVPNRVQLARLKKIDGRNKATGHRVHAPDMGME